MLTRVKDWLRLRTIAAAAALRPGASRELANYWDSQIKDPVKRRQFLDGIGNAHAPGRLQVRQHIIDRGYRTMLDAGCGPAIDFPHYRGRLDYLALDFAEVWQRAAAANRIPFVAGSIEALPFKDRAFDVAYARAVLEHRPYYETGMRELARVADREAIVVFFRLREDEDLIRPDVENNIHHNNYARGGVERLARTLPGVQRFEWLDVPGQFHVLHLYKSS